jgi:hypothetical protein
LGFPPGQPLFNFRADHFPRLLPVAVLHEEFVVAGVFVPDMSDDGSNPFVKSESLAISSVEPSGNKTRKSPATTFFNPALD